MSARFWDNLPLDVGPVIGRLKTGPTFERTGTKTMHLRPMTDTDRAEVAELIYVSINTWYQKHGRPRLFLGGPQVTEVYYDVYNALTPGCSVVAENPRSGRIMGSCFYHPRANHVSVGIMNVH